MDSFRVQPSVCFKVEKIIGVSVGEGNMRNYQVQWAPTWVSGLHLVGCEYMIDEFLQTQELPCPSPPPSQPQQQQPQQPLTFEEDVPTVEVIPNNNDDAFWEKELAEKVSSVQHRRKSTDVFERIIKKREEEEEHSSDTNGLYFKSRPEVASVEIIDDADDPSFRDSNESLQNNDPPNPNFQWMEESKTQNEDLDSSLSFPYGDINESNVKIENEEGEASLFGNSYSDAEYYPREIPTMELEPFNNKDEPGSADNFHHSHMSAAPSHHSTQLGPNEHECHECHKLFRSVNELKKHIRLHTGQKPYMCGVCRKTFTTKGSLKMHYELHSGIKRHQCRVCNKVFSQKHYLKSHERQHAGDNPFNCTECGKSFTSKVNLETHFRLHTGEKPYRCDVCDKRFTQKGNLQSHMSRIHKNVVSNVTHVQGHY